MLTLYFAVSAAAHVRSKRGQQSIERSVVFLKRSFEHTSRIEDTILTELNRSFTCDTVLTTVKKTLHGNRIKINLHLFLIRSFIEFKCMRQNSTIFSNMFGYKNANLHVTTKYTWFR